MEGKKCWGGMIAKILVIIGGINWGLVGVGYFVAGNWEAWNVVHMLLSSVAWLEAVVYILVGLSALVSIWGCKCKACGSCCEVK